MASVKHTENLPKGTFTISENNEFAGEMTYSWAGDAFFIIDHTLVEEKFAGKGYGKQLVMAAVDYAREKKVKILPLCTYAKSVMDRDASTSDVRR